MPRDRRAPQLEHGLDVCERAQLREWPEEDLAIAEVRPPLPTADPRGFALRSPFLVTVRLERPFLAETNLVAGLAAVEDSPRGERVHDVADLALQAHVVV